MKKTHHAQDDATHALKSGHREESEIDLGSVDGLFELYKLRCDIEKAKAEIMATKVLSGYRHSFGSLLLNSSIRLRCSTIEKLIEDKKRELNEQKNQEASRLAYEFLILQDTSIKCVLEQKYDELINITLFENHRSKSQQEILAVHDCCLNKSRCSVGQPAIASSHKGTSFCRSG